jgi:hypothetical protein
MPLPPHALAKLAEAKLEAELRELALGQCWWIPKEYVVYDPRHEHDRYCLIVALEGRPLPARAHFVVGTTKGATGPVLEIAPGELGNAQATELDFSRSFPLDTRTLVKVGVRKRDLAPERLDEVRNKILASNLIAVQRLTK